jgi:DNA-binding transcriptional MerR regulator
MTYRIGTVAAKMGLSPSTIRFYDKHGLLPFVQRDANGDRQFTDNDLNYLDVITALKRSGVPVDTIAHFIELCMQGDSTLTERYHYLQVEGDALAGRIKELQAQMAFLKFKQWYYETAIAAGTEAIHFKSGTHDFDPAAKREYMATHPEETDFKKFID